jgi:hypothetical protein
VKPECHIRIFTHRGFRRNQNLALPASGFSKRPYSQPLLPGAGTAEWVLLSGDRDHGSRLQKIRPGNPERIIEGEIVGI